MKTKITIIFMIGVLHLLGNRATVQADENSDASIKNLFQERCNKYSPRSYNELYDSYESFARYLKLSFEDFLNDHDQFCDEKRGYLEAGLKDVTDKMMPCMPSTESYLPDLLYKSFKGALSFLCKNNHKNLNIIFAREAQQCRTNLTTNTNQLENCFGKIFAPLKSTIKKQEFCDDIGVAKKCFSQMLETQCRNVKSYKEANNEFFEQISKPCGGAFTALANFALIASVFFAIKLLW